MEEGGLRLNGLVKGSSERYPLVSIVTVAFNGSDLINATVKSVVDQTYNNFEYIIIDGASKDGTLEIIKKYNHKIDYWISEPDGGIYDAMNKAIDLAAGVWINFMNVGDTFKDKDVLRSVFENEEFKADIIYGEALVEYPTFSTLLKKQPIDSIWKGMCFCHQASFVNAALMKAWKFDLQYKLSSDYDFFYKAYLAKRKFQFINLVVCNYNYRDGISKRNILNSLKERKKIVLRSRFSLKVWMYYNLVGFRVVSALLVKKVFGNKVTAWVTKLLRRN